jgi:hypothetical protein
MSKTADGLLPDKVHRQLQGILYCQNAIQSHGTSTTIIFTSAQQQIMTYLTLI